MNSKIFRSLGKYALLFGSKFRFAKENKNNIGKTRNQGYYGSRMTAPEVPKGEKKNEVAEKIVKLEAKENETKIDDQEEIDFNLKMLIFGNVAFAGMLPLSSSLNIGIAVLNGGFILGRIGQELKQYLLLISNEHYEQLSHFRKPHDYLKLVMHNLLFLSLSGVFAAFAFYDCCHLLTMTWYGFNILKEVFPFNYWIIVLPLLAAIFLNQLSKRLQSAMVPDHIEAFKALESKYK